MNVFKWLELAGVVLAVLFLLLQVVVPAFVGRPLFPLFRSKKVRQAEQQLEHAHEEQLYQDVLDKLHEAQKEIDATQSRRKS